MSNATAGVGTVIQRYYNDTWTNIAEVNTVGLNGNTRDIIDVTSLASVNGYREFIKGFKDAGSIELELNCTRDILSDFLIDFENNIFSTFRITLPDTVGTTFMFSGYVVNYSLAIVADDKVTLSVSVKVTGQILVLDSNNLGFPYTLPFILA